MRPWTPEEISKARAVPFRLVLESLGAYHKVDRDYSPADPDRKSMRLHVNFRGRNFQFILTDEKFVNELMPREDPSRGGGGAIDFARHLCSCNFVQAVKICIDAIGAGASK